MTITNLTARIETNENHVANLESQIRLLEQQLKDLNNELRTKNQQVKAQCTLKNEWAKALMHIEKLMADSINVFGTSDVVSDMTEDVITVAHQVCENANEHIDSTRFLAGDDETPNQSEEEVTEIVDTVDVESVSQNEMIEPEVEPTIEPDANEADYKPASKRFITNWWKTQTELSKEILREEQFFNIPKNIKAQTKIVAHIWNLNVTVKQLEDYADKASSIKGGMFLG